MVKLIIFIFLFKHSKKITIPISLFQSITKIKFKYDDFIKNGDGFKVYDIYLSTCFDNVMYTFYYTVIIELSLFNSDKINMFL